MTTVQIKKGKGIEGIVEGVEGTPEEQKEIEAENNRFTELLGFYESKLNDKSKFGHIIKSEDLPVLAPEEIDMVLTMTMKYNNDEDYPEFTGTFISYLVQKSFEAGHNDFTLRTGGLGLIDYLGVMLRGYEEDRIRLTIEGDVGDEFGAYSSYALFEINGNVENYLADHAYRSEFTIHGTIDVFLDDDIDECVFKTPNKECMRTLMEHVPKGTLIFIHQDGREEEMYDFDDIPD